MDPEPGVVLEWIGHIVMAVFVVVIELVVNRDHRFALVAKLGCDCPYTGIVCAPYDYAITQHFARFQVLESPLVEFQERIYERLSVLKSEIDP
jgi:hypothetical protein